MASQYSHKQFFRQVPNSHLANYFDAKGINLKVDFSALNEKRVDSLFVAFTGLPEEMQATVESEFQDIHAMACEGGVAALIDESVFHEDEVFVASIAAIDGFHAKAMWAFIDSPLHIGKNGMISPLYRLMLKRMPSMPWRKLSVLIFTTLKGEAGIVRLSVIVVMIKSIFLPILKILACLMLNGSVML